MFIILHKQYEEDDYGKNVLNAKITCGIEKLTHCKCCKMSD